MQQQQQKRRRTGRVIDDNVEEEAAAAAAAAVGQQQQQQQQTARGASALSGGSWTGYLARRNGHARDGALSFDEPTHVYTIAHDSATRYVSVTGLNGQLFEHFDAPRVAARVAAKADGASKKREYWGKSAAELVAMWAAKSAAASAAGTAMHLSIERYYNAWVALQDHDDNNAGDNDGDANGGWTAAQLAEMRAAVALCSGVEEKGGGGGSGGGGTQEQGYFARWWGCWRSAHLTPWRTEWCVYWEEYKLAGSIDMVFRDPHTGALEVHDWKRVDKPLSPGHANERWPTFSRGCPGLEHVPDNEYWHYALQLNLYKRMLEQPAYGERVTALVLVVLHPANADYRRVELPVLDREMDAVLAFRRAQLVLTPLPPKEAAAAAAENSNKKRRREQREDEDECGGGCRFGLGAE